METSVRNSNNFDFIRFVCAIAVIYTHSYPLLGLPEVDIISSVTNGIASFSHIAVRMFFTISCFLICQSAFYSENLSSYFWRRSLRIFPGLFVVILFSAFIIGPIVSKLTLMEYFNHPEFRSYLKSINIYRISQFLPGCFEKNPHFKSVNGSLWTLPYEFSFYIIVGTTIYLRKIFNNIPLLIAILVTSTGLIKILSLLSPSINLQTFIPYLNLQLSSFIDFTIYFGIGSLFFYYQKLIKLNFYYSLVVLILWVVCSWALRPFGELLNYLAIPYLCFYLAYIPGKLNKFGKYGDLSYGIYIYAFPIQQTIVYFMGPNLNVYSLTVITIITTIPFAICSWHLVEKRALELKRLNFVTYPENLLLKKLLVLKDRQ